MESRASVQGILREIDGAGSILAQPTQRIEGVFLSVGAELVSCSQLLQKIISQFESLPQEFAGESLVSSTEKLADVGRRALLIAEGMGGAGAGLTQLSKALGEASSPVDQLCRSVKMMGIVATNARVGAASLVDKADGFGAFADEVSTLAQSMMETVAEFSRTFMLLSRAVSDVIEVQRRFVATQREPLAATAIGLQRKLESVMAERQQAIARSAETGRMSRAIVMRVSETVMAMQAGDSVRQRLEHVNSVLGLLRQDAEAGGPVSRLLALQVRQLDGAREMLGTEIEAASESVSQLSDDVQQLLEQSGSTLHGKGDQSALTELQGVVVAAINVLRTCEVERLKLDATAGDVSRTVKSMLQNVESVERLEQKMRILSLNAAVRCSRLDQRGKALNVIAQQLRDLTKDVLAVAAQSVSILRRAALISEDFSASLAVSETSKISRLEDDAKSSLLLLESFDKKLESAVAALAEDVPRVTNKLDKVRKLLLTGHSIVSEVREAGDRLAALECGIVDDGEPVSFPEIRQIYTMDAERQIHDDFVSATEVSSAA